MAIESHITKIPENQNYLQTTKFIFSVADMPYTRYFCQSVMIPTVSTSEVQQPTPGFADVWRHGDTLVYEPLTITLIIDEELRQWQEAFKWLVAITAPTKFPEYGANSGHDLYRDGVLTILNNSNLPMARFKFKDCFPISLGAVQFDTQGDADVIMVADFTLRYDTFEFDRL